MYIMENNIFLILNPAQSQDDHQVNITQKQSQKQAGKKAHT